MKKILLAFYIVLFIAVCILNATNAAEKTALSAPVMMKSYFFFTYPPDESHRLHAILYDKAPSKFAFAENYRDISIEDKEISLSVGVPTEVNHTEVSYQGKMVSAIEIVMRVPETNVDLKGASLNIRLNEDAIHTFPFGDILFSEPDENAGSAVEIIGRQSIINNETNIPEAAGYVLFLEVHEPVTLTRFDFGFSQYGIDKTAIQCEPLEGDPTQIAPPIRRTIVEKTDFSLPSLHLKEGRYTVYFPFTINTENPYCLWQLGGRLYYNQGAEERYCPIGAMTFMNIDYTSKDVIQGVEFYE